MDGLDTMYGYFGIRLRAHFGACNSHFTLHLEYWNQSFNWKRFQWTNRTGDARKIGSAALQWTETGIRLDSLIWGETDRAQPYCPHTQLCNLTSNIYSPNLILFNSTSPGQGLPVCVYFSNGTNKQNINTFLNYFAISTWNCLVTITQTYIFSF